MPGITPSGPDKVVSATDKGLSETDKTVSKQDGSVWGARKPVSNAKWLVLNNQPPISTSNVRNRKPSTETPKPQPMASKPITWDGKDTQGSPLLWDTSGLTWDGFLPERRRNMPHLRVLLGFTNAPDHSLEETTGSVIDNLYDNPAYATPPVTKVALQTALTNFTAAIAAMMQGGTASTAEKNDKRDILVGLLRQLASYVQENCDNDLATLLSSGFEAVSNNRSQQPLAKPSIVSVDNGNSGQLLVKVTSVPNARCYEVRYATVGAGGTLGPMQSAGLFTNSRSMPINDLTAGTTYQVQVRAVGGSTGYSDWSDPSSHMSL